MMPVWYVAGMQHSPDLSLSSSSCDIVLLQCLLQCDRGHAKGQRQWLCGAIAANKGGPLHGFFQHKVPFTKL